MFVQAVLKIENEVNDLAVGALQNGSFLFERILVEDLTGENLCECVGRLDFGEIPSLQDEVDQEGPCDDELDEAAEPAIHHSFLILLLHGSLESLFFLLLLRHLVLLALIGFLHLLIELLLL